MMGPDDIDFPPFQGYCVKVSVINGAKSHMRAELLVHPAQDYKKYLNLAGYSFLIESPHCKQKVLFDLAFMKDLDVRMPPSVKALFASGDEEEEEAVGIDEFQDVPDTLKAHNMELSAINAVIWSHEHIDHVGDMSVFPPSTELVVGPGFKARCMPGYPQNPTSSLLDSAFHGRRIREVDFATTTTVIGGFRAVDFFADGSFWLLEAPGHSQHHLCALCRTTDASWIFLGGDACHTVAQLRPNRFRLIPDRVRAGILDNRTPSQQGCNHAHLRRLVLRNPGGVPFYGLAPGMQADPKKAEETLEKLKAFDGREDVLIIIAHDASLLNVLNFFPQEISDWKVKGWAAEGRWLFLREFEE